MRSKVVLFNVRHVNDGLDAIVLVQLTHVVGDVGVSGQLTDIALQQNPNDKHGIN
jgi:hypothetical protein